MPVKNRPQNIKEANAILASRGLTKPKAEDVDALKESGHLTFEQHRDWNWNERRKNQQKSSYSTVQKQVISNTDVSNAPAGLVARVKEKNPTGVEKVQRYKMSEPTVEQAVKSVVKDNRYTEALSYEPMQTKQNPINNDTTHHAALATIADALDSKLDGPSVSSNVVNKAGGHIADFYAYHDTSLQHHNSGDAEKAKNNLQYAADSLIKAHTEMNNRKGISLAPGINNRITSHIRAYSNSTTPGVGAKPNEDFVPNRVLKERPTPQPKPVVKETPKETPRLLNKEQLGQAISEFTSDVPEKPKNVNTPLPPRNRAEMRYQKGVDMKLKGLKEPRQLSLASKKEQLEKPENIAPEEPKEPGFTGQDLISQQLQHFAKGRYE